MDPSGNQQQIDSDDPGHIVSPEMNCMQFVESIPTNSRIPDEYRKLIQGLGPQILCGTCPGGGVTFPSAGRCVICLAYESDNPNIPFVYKHEDIWIGLLINGLVKCQGLVDDKKCQRHGRNPIFGGELPALPGPDPNPTDKQCDDCLRGNEKAATKQCEYLYSKDKDIKACKEAAICGACRDLCPPL
jgi:hypothetical protein